MSTPTDTRTIAVAHPDDLPERPRQTFRKVGTVLVGVLVLWSVLGLDVRWSRLIDAPGDLFTVFRLMFTNMEMADLPRLLEAMWESIAMAWLGTMIGAAFALPLAFVAAENLVGRTVSTLVRQVLNLLRAIPEVILAIALVPVLGLSPSTGVLAIGIGSIGTLGKLCSEIIEGIRSGPIEGVDAVGAGRLQRLRWGVVPQVLPEMASFVLYRFEINIRVSAVLGIVGAGGIGGIFVQNLQFKNWGVAGMALIILVLATIAVDLVSGWVRRRIIAGPPRTSHSGEARAEFDPMVSVEPVT